MGRGYSNCDLSYSSSFTLTLNIYSYIYFVWYQMNSKTGGQDRYKLLLERLKMIEGENSSLVLENEQQRGQYEKCLDEIANQV